MKATGERNGFAQNTIIILAVVILAVFGLVSRAQETATSVQAGTGPARVKKAPTMDTNLAAALAAIQQLPTVPADSVPMTGNFYSAQNPNWPPLPGNVWELSAWDLGDGFYLLNDLDLNYTQLQTASSATERTMAMNMSLLEGGGGLGLQAPQYTTNDLWLEIVTTNSAASLIVHSP